jgi:cytochrome c
MRRLTLTLIALVCLGMSTANAAGGTVAGDPVAGKRAFAKCASCHSVGPSARGNFGPQLNGLVGRPAGSTKDFKYSPAMRDAGFVWTEARLRAFLRSPDDIVPGNKMRFRGISSEREIDDLLAYLRGF